MTLTPLLHARANAAHTRIGTAVFRDSDSTHRVVAPQQLLIDCKQIALLCGEFPIHMQPNRNHSRFDQGKR